jgi:polyphosphate kinase 2 (PPK2 family)
MKKHDKDIFEIDGSMISLDELVHYYQKTKADKKSKNKAEQKRDNEQQLKPYQAELIKLQKYLENSHQKMIILFEGRDAAGKGGTIRRVTRYMDEKHYRIVALGKPTEEQKNAVVLPKIHPAFSKSRRDSPF